MVVQLSDQPTSSLPPTNQPKLCKTAESESAADSEISNICFTASTSLSSGVNIPQCCVARIIKRADELGQYVKQFFAFVATKIREFVRPNQSFFYKEVPLSLESQNHLLTLGRKTLILDLDETLVHSCYIDPDTHDTMGCNFVPEIAVPDYQLSLQIMADLPPIDFQVFKRPHVDEFLDFVGKWYDLVIYTASLEAYASTVVDKLDAGRGILQRRFYRQHCLSSTNLLTKNLTVVNRDLTSVCIIDNSPSAYRDYPENAIPIKTYIYDPQDEELLNLLPFLDALRFTRDVRTILGRRGTMLTA